MSEKLQNFVVLVIEDEPLQRASLAQQLRRAGVRHILQAEGGDQAIRGMQTMRIDLVLCDIGMPGMDGPQFILHQLDQLAAMPPPSSVPRRPMLAWMSVLGSDILASHVQMARMAGFSAVMSLPKPLDDAAVQHVVAAALLARSATPERRPALPSPELGDSLLRALCDPGEFDVWYRPLLRLDDARLVGAQAVVRWSQPVSSLMLGQRQLAMLVEQQGLGLVLFYRTVNHVLQLQRRLQAAGHALLVSIEVTARTLLAPEIVDYLVERVRLHRLRPDLLVVLVSDVDVDADADTDAVRLAICLNRLRIQGFSVYLNGFGAGRANLDLLADLPFDGVCIDGELVRRAQCCVPARQLVESIAALGAGLCIDVIADAVDSAPGARALGAMGCRLGQGRIAEPLTATALLQAASGAQAVASAQIQAGAALTNGDPCLYSRL